MPTEKTKGRPEQIYLDPPVILHGIKVSHTKEGLEYLIDHYTSTMHHPYLTDSNKQHRKWLIDNWKIHLELYNRKQ